MIARPTCPFARYRLPRIIWISSASVLPMLVACVSSSIGLVHLVVDEKVQAEHVVRRLAEAAPIDPAAVAQLVALPRLADDRAR